MENSILKINIKTNQINMEQIHIQRLAKFADYLDGLDNNRCHLLTNEVEFVELEKKKRVHYRVIYQPAIFDHLPNVFPDEWYFDEDIFLPTLIGIDSDLGVEYGIFEFFEIKPTEFAHCFDVSSELQNCEAYGGKVLDVECSPSDIAENIIDLIKRQRKLLEKQERSAKKLIG